MIQFRGLDQNLRFLIVEVRSQLLRTRDFLASPTPEVVDRVVARENYINHLKGVIHRKCFGLLSEEDEAAVRVDMVQAFDVVSQNLERIADCCLNVVEQVRYVEDEELLAQEDFGPFFDQLITGVELIERGVSQRDVRAALRICRLEHEIDRLYSRALHRHLEELEKGENAQSLVTIIFIHRYIERMGDALLNVGEAILSACLGEPIKVGRLRALEDSLEASALPDDVEDVTLEPIGETRSGCWISRVERAEDEGAPVVFKRGQLSKLDRERQSNELWQELMPGLVPRVHSFEGSGDKGSILFEYLPGSTFEELLVQGELAEVERALGGVCRTLRTLWTKTREDGATSTSFMEQLGARLPEVFSVHPEFARSRQTIGAYAIPSFEELRKACEPLEQKVGGAFSVFGHGDFNVDNIIIGSTNSQVHFIDLHRSKHMDYTRDLSVFMVSNMRLQAIDSHLQARIGAVVLAFYEFARGFAQEIGDPTFDVRLALGLARSLATSTRFVLDPQRARSLFSRSRYLLQELKDIEDPAAYTLPREVLLD